MSQLRAINSIDDDDAALDVGMIGNEGMLGITLTLEVDISRCTRCCEETLAAPSA